MKQEIEIKLCIDEQDFKVLVLDLNDFQFETTYGFFTSDYQNVQKGIFPRIKVITKDNNKKAFVTVKVKKEINSGYFVRDEHEYTIDQVSDDTIQSARGVFNALEYVIEEIFEKKRYILKSLYDCDIVLDVLPFGNFLEIEGAEENIEQAIVALGLENKERVNGAYLKLWDEYKLKHNLTGDCVFSS